MSLVYLLLAALGLGFLVFIHELGHYFMARRLGMKVEAFGIGFGKPFRTWERDGVKWNLCWLPFGGYVKIAGMEKQDNVEPHQIEGGFFSKSPWARIQVLLMGPLVNIVFAFVIFSVIWMQGGRVKPFAEFTHRIGWIDQDAKLYAQGVRPGDEIDSYNGAPFRGINDLLYASFLDSKPGELKGFELDYWTQSKKPFRYMLDPSQELKGYNLRTHALGIIGAASYLIFEKTLSGSPMQESGIQRGDRIVWADGDLIFSQTQMVQGINESRVLLTVRRKDKIFLTRLPRIQVRDLKMNGSQKAELDDWQHAAGLRVPLPEIYFIPYNLTSNGVVEEELFYMGHDAEEHKVEAEERSPFVIPLRPGDQILAVDGTAIANAKELLQQMQERHVLMVVERDIDRIRPLWKNADAQFDQSIDWGALQKMLLSIGTAKPVNQAGNLYLLKPITPRPYYVYAQEPDKIEDYTARMNALKDEIAAIKDPKQRALAELELEASQKQLYLGITLMDRGVIYNPPPATLFFDVFKDTWRTIKALVTGYLSPKMLQGPVGIVQVIQYGWSIGVKEALFWIGMISLNLGIFNLLPIPMLDGGYICFSLWESCTKKPIGSKTMEKFIVPFLVLIVIFFIYVTYNDLSRLIHRFF